MKSRPVWGAWIEIRALCAACCLTPSRPVWGAWIEIRFCVHLLPQKVPSRPVWGAWIEINVYVSLDDLVFGRAPYEARGLKYLLKI